MKKVILLLILFVTIPVYPMDLDQATFTVGMRLFDQGLYSEAEPRFLDIVRKYPDSKFYRKSLFYLGQTYAHTGKHKSALQYYKVLLNKSRTVKDKQQALLGISKSWLELGVHDKAGDFYTFFASEYPESEHAPTALYFAGIAREREDKISSAVEKYRAVLELYPESDFFAKAIEKVAVLSDDTPETLWMTQSADEPSNSVNLFADDEFNIDEGFTDTDFRAQSSDPRIRANIPLPIPMTTPSVVTQMIIQAPPTVITQLVDPIIITQMVQTPPKIITQLIETPPVIVTQNQVSNTTPISQHKSEDLTNTQNMLTDTQKMINSSVVQLSNKQYIAVDSSKEIANQKELEQYKKIWEAEYQQKLKEEELIKAQNAVKELAQLSSDKAAVLQVKERTLQEQQNRLRSDYYRELQQSSTNTIEQEFTGPPLFLGGQNTVATNNVPTPTPESVVLPLVVEEVESITPPPIVEEVVESVYPEEVVDYIEAEYLDGEEYIDGADYIEAEYIDGAGNNYYDDAYVGEGEYYAEE